MEKKVLAKLPNKNQVYLVENGTKHFIANSDALSRHGFDPKNVTELVYPDALMEIPIGGD